MHYVRLVVSAALFLMSVSLSSAQTTPSEQSAPSTPDVPENVRSDGSYTDFIPFDIPEFRGLEPELGLSYRSSFNGRGVPEAYLGVGWQLTGFSSIERVAERGGIPTYSDGDDIYRLDGEDLMVCADAGATNPWPTTPAYPANFKTEVASASCASGGNMSTRVESFLKITRLQETHGTQQVDYFVVTRSDGTQLHYHSIGVLAGDTTAATSPIYPALFKRKWLLTEIRDTQATPNVVTFIYAFDTAARGLAHRPTSVSYGGYQIGFEYVPYVNGLDVTYAVGLSGVLGRQANRLAFVSVVDGATRIRAYDLQYAAPTGQTGSTLLSAVRTLGNDFVGGAAPSGTLLAQPISLIYAPDVVSTGAPQSYTGVKFGPNAIIIDIDQDGRDDILQSTTTLNAPAVGTCSSGATVGLIDFDVAAFPTVSPLPAGVAAAEANGSKFLGLTAFDPIAQAYFAISGFATQTENECGSQGNPCGSWSSRVSVVPLGGGTATILSSTSGSSTISFNPPAPAAAIFGNFDADAAPEAYITAGNNAGTFRQISNGAVTADGTSAINSHLVNGVSFDTNGDGRDERVILSASTTVATITYARRLNGAGFSSPAITIPNPLYQIATPLSATPSLRFGIGDLNGDESDDLVIWNISASTTAPDQLYVAFGNGRGFEKAVQWATSPILPNLTATANPRARLLVRDINGDYLDDIILDAGQNTTGTNCATYQTLIYTSTGTGLAAPTDPGITGLATVGDLNGDGLLDFLSVGANGSVRYGSGGVPNLLTSIVNPSGGETRVTYSPSSAGGNNNNKIPGVMQLVTAIETRSGTGSVDVVSYSYTNGVYDYENRKPLGYNTVTAQLPAVAGETAGPIVTTMYENASFWMHGAMKSENVRVGLTSYSNTYNTWTTTGSGRGPYRFDKVSERMSTAYGTSVVETRRDYTYNLHGQIATVIDFGFSTAGADNSPDDDTVVSIDYQPNTSLYIVDKPKVIRTQRGSVSSWDLATFLKAELFRYDGNAQHFEIPLRGNLTEYLHWNGNLAGLSQRSIRRATYDAFGNALTETDAAGNVTTHTYDTTKRLFRLTTTNALGHAAQTAWNTGCQLPLSVTEANGLVTSFAYDVHCRETRRDLPNGQYQITRYANFGTPTTQYTERESKSASTVTGRTLQIQREYFDGLGRVYKTTTSGTTSAIEDSIVQLRGYDARSNMAWQSIPLTWAAALSNTTTAAQRTTYSYDPLNRPLRETYADGTYQTTTYVTQSFASTGATTMLHPGVTIKDSHCFDAAAANTACGETRRYMDDHGNTVRQTMVDVALTDVDAGGAADRKTDYRYDHLDRLIYIVDPAGANWSYTYDIFGNRITADDPGLGAWTMAYNVNNLLTQQTDAKGQVITFAYDALNRPTLKTVGIGTARIETRFTYDQTRAGYHNIGQQTTQEVWTASTATTTARVERDYHTTGAVQVERHSIDGRTYALESSFAPNGAMLDQRLPNTPGATTTAWVGAYSYDAANRMTAMAGRVTSVTYDLRSQPIRTDFANGTWEIASYNSARGWLNAVDGYLPGAAPLFRAGYTRSATGRISQYDTGTAANDAGGSYNYTYDYAGRLLTAANFRAALTFDQVMAYDSAGRIRAKGPSATQTTAYTYGGTAPDHAPASVATAGVSTAFSYDANGNMLTGLGGRTMTYDAENRPLSVTVNNKRTCYVYGVDGTRLKKIENLAANANCAAIPATAVSTVYFGAVEVRNWLVPAQEQVLTYPSASLKLTNGVASYLHRDHLGSVRAITNAAGTRVESAIYKPFGEQTEFVTPGLAAPESKGWIGERYDADAGLQYLNARYYDPVLGLFLQPDWFEVLKPGVGTNRFSYSFNDPVNKLDPLGNQTLGDAFRNAINSFLGFNPTQRVSDERTADNARTLRNAVASETRAIPSRTASGLLDAYEFARRRTMSGSAVLPDVGAMLDGDAIEIVSALPVPGARLAGPVLEAAADVARVVCSFDGDTLVLSEHGLVPIASIKPLQDRVWSTDEQSGMSEWNMVLAQSVASYDHEVLVTLRDVESGDEQTITSNRIHPYFAQVPESAPFNVASEGIAYTGPIIGGRWIDAGDLKPGYLLLNNHGAWVEVVSVKERPRDLQAWNLTVEAAHSFYVAETIEDDAVWVHNSCVNPNVLNHIFGKPSHQLDDLLASFDGDQVKAYEAVLEAATDAHRRGTLSLGPNGVIPRAGNVFNVNGNLVQLSGGRLDPVTGLLDIRSFSGVVRLP